MTLFSSCSLLWGVGALTVAYWALVILKSLWKRLLRPSTNMSRFGTKKGAWAVVTGASDGIGKAFCFEAAKRGFNVLLISRTQKKLEDVQEELSKKYPNAKTEILAIDFSSNDNNIYDEIKDAITKCGPVGILVNNVGVNYPYPGNYLDMPQEQTDAIVRVNIQALNEMVRIVLPQMTERGYGGIINLSSLSGVAPAPMLSAYSASKAYIDFFSQCLAAEYGPKIAVQSITPSMVVSNMSKVRKPSLLAGITTPGVIARGSLNTLGQETRWSPYWGHAIIEFFLVRVIPLNMVLSQILGMHKGIRKRALAKEQRERNATTTTDGNKSKVH